MVAGGNAPGNSPSSDPDPAGVEEKPLSQQCLAPLTRLCDPCRVGWSVVNPSGGVAPGYSLLAPAGLSPGSLIWYPWRRLVAFLLSGGFGEFRDAALPFACQDNCSGKRRHLVILGPRWADRTSQA